MGLFLWPVNIRFIRIFLQKIKNKALRLFPGFLLLQLFLTLISLPILVAWGLPLSWFTILGNILFSPFLTVYLFLGSLIFFMELAAIPNEWLIWLLAQVTYLWQWMLSWSSERWLYALPVTIGWLYWLMPVVTCAIMSYRFFRSEMMRCLALTILFFLCFLLVYSTHSKRPVVTYCACNGGSVAIIDRGDKTIVIDTGVLGRSASSVSWCCYELLSELLKVTGRTTIHMLISLQPTTFTFEAFTAIHARVMVEYTYVPYWKGKISWGAWRAFKKLKDDIVMHGRVIKSIGLDSASLLLTTQKDGILLEPLSDTIAYHNALYPVIRAVYFLDNQGIEFYPLKYLKKKNLH